MLKLNYALEILNEHLQRKAFSLHNICAIMQDSGGK